MNPLPQKKYSSRILKIAFPAIAGLSSQMIVSIIDTAMVGRLDNSEISLAAMGLGVLATWTLTSFFSSLATGTHILVARRYGQGKHTAVGIVLNNSLVLSFVLGVLFGVLGYFFAYDAIVLFSSDDNVALAAGQYIKYRSLGLPFFLLGVSYRGFFYGIGHTKIFMFSAILMYIVNIVFNYFLIFGTAGFPKMGLGGAGLAASIGMAVGLLFFVIVTFLPDYRKKYRYYQVLAIGLDYIKPIVRISLPVSFQNILILLGFLVFVAIAGIFGIAEQAATQVVISALFLSFMPCFGFGIATQTLVGNELGNNEPEEAYRYGIETAKIGTIFTIFVGILFFLIPDFILRVITPNETVISVARPLLLMAGAAQIAYGSGIILANALQAAGATLYVMFLEIITHWVIFLPLAYVLGVQFGIQGAWMALPVYIVSYTTMAYLKFRSRTWTALKV
ncbi:MAG: MATE family efflux transporter [Ignavibacteriales bacterium]|nr:MATE family efflux transporter [Ignavibacteriales bacterium]